MQTIAPALHQRKGKVGERADQSSSDSTAVNISVSGTAQMPGARPSVWRRLIRRCTWKQKHDKDDELEDGIVYREPLWQRLLLACLCGSSVCCCLIFLVLLVCIILLAAYTYNVDQVQVRDARDLAATFGKKTAVTSNVSPARAVFDALQLESTGAELNAFGSALGAIEARLGSEGLLRLTSFLADESLGDVVEQGRISAGILRAPGYQHVTGTTSEEVEAHRPMDDISLLQWRHELSASTSSSSSSASSLTPAEMTELKVRLYGGASVLNRRYYHGVRRAERAAPYTSASAWTTKGWYDAVAASALWDVYGDAGVADVSATASASASGVRLRVADVSAARVRAIGEYESHGDLLPPHGDVRADVPTVFVSLASYRDAQCAPTLVDLFAKAKNAHRVYVGLAEQNRAGDGSCVAPLELHEPAACLTPAAFSDASAAESARVAASVLVNGGVGGVREGLPARARGAVDDYRRGVCFHADHVRVRAIDAAVARGPTYGRYMAMLLYRGESLTLVLDSHNRFTPFWDTLATHQYYRYDDPKTVLSHYPAALEFSQLDNPGYFWQRDVAYLCRAYFLVHYGFLRLDAAIVSDPSAHVANNAHNQPYIHRASATSMEGWRNFRLPQPWIAGGFLFANSTIMREVPFDPHLPHLFDGEEMLYSVRLWTHGYNMFSPAVNIVYHYYGRDKAPRVFDTDPSKWMMTQAISRERVRFFLRSRVGPGIDQIRVPSNTSMVPVVVDSDRYGIGQTRTVEQWYQYAGANPVTFNVDGRWCAPHMYADHTVLEAALKKQQAQERRTFEKNMEKNKGT